MYFKFLKSMIIYLQLIFVVSTQLSGAAEDSFGNNDYLHDKIKSEGWVKVRIWEDEISLQRPDPGKRGNLLNWILRNCGHVSLETKDSYLSLWPNWHSPAGETQTAYPLKGWGISSTPAHILQNPAQDIKNEGRTPDHVFILKLNTKIINRMFDYYLNKHLYSEVMGTSYLMKDTLQWYSLGVAESPRGAPSFPIDPNKRYFNCASFVWTALALSLAVEGPQKEAMDFAEQSYRILGAEKAAALRACLEGCRADMSCNEAVMAFWINFWKEPSMIFPADILKILQSRHQQDFSVVLENLRLPESLTADTIIGQYNRAFRTSQVTLWRSICESPTSGLTYENVGDLGETLTLNLKDLRDQKVNKSDRKKPCATN